MSRLKLVVLVRISTTMLVNVLALSDLAVKKFPLEKF